MSGILERIIIGVIMGLLSKLGKWASDEITKALKKKETNKFDKEALEQSKKAITKKERIEAAKDILKGL